MSNNQPESQDDNVAVSVGQLKKVMGFMQEQFTSALADLERRNDETLTARLRDETIARERDRNEIVEAINKLSEGMRIISQQKGSAKSDVLAEVVELIKPAIQARIMPGQEFGSVTGETSKLADLVALGITREINSDLKLRARTFLKKGRLFTNEVVAAGVDGVIDKAVDSHARI